MIFHTDKRLSFHFINELENCCHDTSDADMEDYGFEYSEEEPEEQDVDIENQYYNSKGNCLVALFFFFASLFYINGLQWMELTTYPWMVLF